MIKKQLKTVLALAVIITFSACKKEEKVTENTVTETSTEVPTPVNNNTAENVNITLESNDQMQYNLSEIKVPVGKPVILTLKHTGKMAKEVMGHNFVLLGKNVKMDEFIGKAGLAKDNDYIPQAETANIIAHTKMIGGGESATVEFVIKEAGTYDYLCTFPGHAAMMKGKLNAE